MSTWVKPEVICQVRFLEWTSRRMLRAPVFVGLRDDKAPRRSSTRSTVERAGAGLRALSILTGKEVIADVDGQRLKFTNLDKVFFPKDGWKKRDVLAVLRSRVALGCCRT